MPRQRPSNTGLRARWVEQAALSLKVKLLPGISTWEDIAKRISDVGQQVAKGEKPNKNTIGCPVPPAEVEFPEDYSITSVGCIKAVKAALKRIPQPAAQELRAVDTDRCEDLLSRLRTDVVKGEPSAVRAYVKVLEHMSRTNCYAASDKSDKIEVTDLGRSPGEDDEKFKLMAARLDDNDQLALLALMNKARGGTDST
jgi:hypothetical protein